MTVIAANEMKDEVLISYDQMMIATVSLDRISGLAMLVWADVLEELGSRHLVSLVSGSYADASRALITRNYPTS